MKKMYVFLAIASVGLFSLTSFSDDHSVIKSQATLDPNHIVGKWNATESKTLLEVEGKLVTTEPDKDTPIGFEERYEFKTDKTVNYYINIPKSETTEGRERESNSTYEISGDLLIIKYAPDPINILFLNDHLLYTQKVSEGISPDGERYKITKIMKYEKM